MGLYWSSGLRCELKHQREWGGVTTRDLARCRLMARMVALAYDGLTLFVRFARPRRHFEAISSRALFPHGGATQTQHPARKRVTVAGTHARQGYHTNSTRRIR